MLTENFDWHKEFPDIMKNGGFDVVIGNPPYIKEYTNRQAFDGLHAHYCYQGKMDLWYFFGALALEIVKKDTGLIGYIAPNNWITNSGASKFRNIVINNGKLIKFIDFGDFKVFDSAGIQTMIYIMKRSDNNQKYNFDYAKVLDSKIKHPDAQLFLENVKDERFEYFTTEIEKEKYLDKPINFINAGLSIIINKIKTKQNFILNEDEVAQGIVGAPDKAFIILNNQLNKFSIKELAFIKMFHTSSGFYFTPKTSKNIFYLSDKNFYGEIEDYPNILNHFEKFKNDLIEAKIKYKTPNKKYFYLHRERDEKFFKKGEKIICPTRTKKTSCTYTKEEFYGSRALNFIKSNRIDLKYLTGILNSNLSNFWLKYKGKMTGDLLQVDKSQLISIPLIKPTNEAENKISEFVSQIIDNKQKQFDYSSLLEKTKTENNFEREIQLSNELESFSKSIEIAENEINELVYAIYDLTEKEIAEIENAIK